MITCAVTALASIPCLVLRDDAHAHAPVLVWHHGWSGNKGDAAQPPAHLRALAAGGVIVVCPDAPGHGERADPASAHRRQFNGWAVICAAMEQARAETSRLLDAALALPDVDTDRALIAGISMGGVIAQVSFASEPRFRALASVIGRSSLHQADPWCRDAQRGTWCERWCDAHALAAHPTRCGARPVLFVDGGRDDDCPARINGETVARINAAGGCAEQAVDPSCGHDFTAWMQDRVRAWLLAQARLAI